MLFYDKSLMNEAWVLAKKLYRENKLDGVKSMKCSTAYENPRASQLDEGIIILYCSNSSNEETIMNIGKKILEMFDYKEKQIVYYKTDLQTREGTIATGSKKNHTYKLFNTLYKGKCLIKLQGSNPFLEDKNSAINILNLTECWIHNQTRPVEFQFQASSFTCGNKKTGLSKTIGVKKQQK